MPRITKVFFVFLILASPCRAQDNLFMALSGGETIIYSGDPSVGAATVFFKFQAAEGFRKIARSQSELSDAISKASSGEGAVHISKLVPISDVAYLIWSLQLAGIEDASLDVDGAGVFRVDLRQWKVLEADSSQHKPNAVFIPFQQKDNLKKSVQPSKWQEMYELLTENWKILGATDEKSDRVAVCSFAPASVFLAQTKYIPLQMYYFKQATLDVGVNSIGNEIFEAQVFNELLNQSP